MIHSVCTLQVTENFQMYSVVTTIPEKEKGYDPYSLDKESGGQRREAIAQGHLNTGCLTPGTRSMFPHCLPDTLSAASLGNWGPVSLPEQSMPVSPQRMWP